MDKPITLYTRFFLAPASKQDIDREVSKMIPWSPKEVGGTSLIKWWFKEFLL